MMLTRYSVAKPWGRTSLPFPFDATPSIVAGDPIGEIWFQPPSALPDLLVKYIFTNDKLSVQVHPSDVQAAAIGGDTRGKEECWLIIDADPGAKVAIGFHEPVSPDKMRAAALDGSIEGLLEWHPVRRGDFFYIPAGTVHAIGPGVCLIEVQQNSDTTYRMFDYGRPRSLHLDAAIAVASGARYDRSAWHRHIDDQQSAGLVDNFLFRLNHLVGSPDPQARTLYGHKPLLVLPMDGSVQINGEIIAAGCCALVAAIDQVEIPTGVRCLVAQPSGA